MNVGGRSESVETWERVDSADPTGPTVLGEPEVPDADGIRRGTKIDRFVLLERLGQGGMGVVYSAYDPDLDRKVAIKLLRPGKAQSATQRLLREAQAMARLSHPNVITVHEVGTVEGRVYVAMELVAGRTLRQWLREKTRSWDEIAPVCIAAGRGLAAAHGAGIVHRDFKPDNVMVGDDGRVRVLDFGLARGTENASGGFTLDEVSSRGATITVAGSVVGTPPYMAPEQLQASPADARSDVYSFCVVLHEAVFGVRPFGGRTVGQVRRAVFARRREEVPEDRRASRRLRRVIERGLRLRAKSRWDSMDELLAELEAETQASRRSTGAIALALLGVVGLGAAVLVDEQDVCRSAGVSLDEVWTEARKQAIRDAILATGRTHADDTWARLEAQLDQYTADWRESSRTTCMVATAGQMSTELADRAAACLASRERQLDALLDVLGRTDTETIDRVLTAAAQLPAVEPCSDPQWLLAEVKPPSDPAAATRVEQARGSLDAARAAMWAGRPNEALEQAQAQMKVGHDVAYEPLVAEASEIVGALQEMSGQFAEAETALDACYFAAGTVGDDGLAASCATRLVRVVGVDASRRDEAMEWAEHARMAASRAGSSLEHRADLADAQALVYRTAGDDEDALPLMDQAIALYEEAGDDHRISRLGVASNRATSLYNLRRLEEAAAAFREVDAELIETLGREHPRRAINLLNYGNLLDTQGKLTEALAAYDEAMAIREAAFGLDSLKLAGPLINSAVTLQQLERAEEAESRLRQGLRLLEAGGHPMARLGARSNLASLLSDRGKHDQARAMSLQTVREVEGILPADHPDRARIWLGYGDVLVAAGDNAEAEVAYEQARVGFTAASGPDHPDVALALVSQAGLAEARGATELAVDLYERVVAIIDATGVYPEMKADCDEALARLRG